MKRIAAALLCVGIICAVAGCGSEYEWEDESEHELSGMESDEE